MHISLHVRFTRGVPSVAGDTPEGPLVVGAATENVTKTSAAVALLKKLGECERPPRDRRETAESVAIERGEHERVDESRPDRPSPCTLTVHRPVSCSLPAYGPANLRHRRRICGRGEGGGVQDDARGQRQDAEPALRAA